jgi:hypothetical protein
MRVFLIAFASSLVPGCATAESQPATKVAEGPLVVELFTSQGCSSCPPADRLLSKLAAEPPDGRALAPLSFHVDYWNDLGWSDPYSLPAWTERQHAYARALRDRRVYTPQLVVGGTAGLVGSDRAAVGKALSSARRPALLPATATWSADAVEITATAPVDADVLVAVWEDKQRTRVTRGENAGSTLGNDRVVRRLERVAPAGKQGTLRVELDPAWKAVGAVAFAQRADMRIVASAHLPR